MIRSLRSQPIHSHWPELSRAIHLDIDKSGELKGKICRILYFKPCASIFNAPLPGLMTGGKVKKVSPLPEPVPQDVFQTPPYYRSQIDKKSSPKKSFAFGFAFRKRRIKQERCRKDHLALPGNLQLYLFQQGKNIFPGS